MARKLRVQYPGAIYHAMNRGDRREPIFRDDRDRQTFLLTLEEACEKTEWQIHAWCLMLNHFHLVIETPRPNLVDGMRWFLGVYSRRFNLRLKEVGHVFSGRYKALLVDGSESGYLKTVCDYVHLNPVRANLVAGEDRIAQYYWSSVRSYLEEPSSRPPWLRTDRLLGEWGIPNDSPAGRREFCARMEGRRRAELEPGYDPYGKEWCVGSETFRQELLRQVEIAATPRHRGPEIFETGVAKAERILREELESRHWSYDNLQTLRKGDPEKVRIAYRLRRETTMTLAWISEHLVMGSTGYVDCLLYKYRKAQAQFDQHESLPPSEPSSEDGKSKSDIL